MSAVRSGVGRARRAYARGGPALLGFLVAGLVVGSGGALAIDYQNTGGHYGFTAPDGWTQESPGTLDVGFLGPEAGGYRPGVVVGQEVVAAAQNGSDWLRTYAVIAFDVVNDTLNVTNVQGPRTFITGAGRLAADYIYEWNLSGMRLRERQILYVSEHYTRIYVLTFTDLSSSFNTHGPEWALIVNSFHVDGEPVGRPAPPGGSGSGSDDSLLLIAEVMAMAGAAMVAVAFVQMRKRQTPVRPPPPLGAAPSRVVAPWPAAPGAPPTSYPRAYTSPPLEFPTEDAPRMAPPRSDSLPPSAGYAAHDVSPARAPPAPAPPPRVRPPVPPAPPSRGAPSAPPARSGGMPAPGTVVGAPPAPAPRAQPAMIKCPKCASKFPGPTSRPATVQCPSCGTKGVMK